MTLELTNRQFLPRGGKLKNTQWIIGIAVYTGHDTCVMQNITPSRHKQSRIEYMINHIILYLIYFQFCCALLIATIFFLWRYVYESWHVYLYFKWSILEESIKLFFTYVVLLNTLIPISLIVSLEVVKLFQAYFIEKDNDMYNKSKNRNARAFSSQLIEELGMVEYVFFDKTGTLTCNQMEFQFALMGDRLFGDRDILRGIQKNHQTTFEDERQGVAFSFDNYEVQDALQHDDKYIAYDVSSTTYKHVLQTRKELYQEFVKAMATCHECLPAQNETSDDIFYQGHSSDEITLVDAAKRFGYEYSGGNEQKIFLNVFGEPYEMDLLKLFENNLSRSRMSIIVRDQGVIKMYIKGADRVIMERLHRLYDDKHNSYGRFLMRAEQKLDYFARAGLRTLMIGMKVFSEDEFQVIQQRYHALIAESNPGPKISALADEIESGLFLLGATAVRDKL